MRCVIVGEAALVKLLVRYNGIGPGLTNDEKEILLFGLYNDSIKHGGLAKKAEERCEMYVKNADLSGGA